MGLIKLEKAAEDVTLMGKELELLQPKLDASTQEVMDLLRVNAQSFPYLLYKCFRVSQPD